MLSVVESQRVRNIYDDYPSHATLLSLLPVGHFIAFSAPPLNNSVITLNGTDWTFVVLCESETKAKLGRMRKANSI